MPFLGIPYKIKQRMPHMEIMPTCDLISGNKPSVGCHDIWYSYFQTAVKKA